MRQAILTFVVLAGLAGTAWSQPQVFYDRYEAGRAQLDKSQFSEAVKTFNAALAAVPPGEAPDPNIYVALGYAQMRLGLLDDAEATFNVAQRQLGKLTPKSRQELQANREVLRLLRRR